MFNGAFFSDRLLLNDKEWQAFVSSPHTENFRFLSWQRLLCLIIVVALGGIHVLSFAPFEQPNLQLLSLGGLYWLSFRSSMLRFAWLKTVLEDASLHKKVRRGIISPAWLGFGFGIGWFGCGIYWPYVAMANHTDLPILLAGLASVLFVLFLATFPLIGLWCFERIARRFAIRAVKSYHYVLLFASCMLAMEWLRSVFLGGFPWINTGYAHTTGVLIGFVPLIGYMGVAWLSLVMAGFLAQVVFTSVWRNIHLCKQNFEFKPTVLTSLMFVSMVLGGLALTLVEWSKPTGHALRVALLQANIPQNIKFLPSAQHGSLLIFERLLAQAKQQSNKPLDLVIMPETGVPDFWQNLFVDNPRYLERLQAMAQSSRFGLMTGMPIAELKNPDLPLSFENARFSNSVLWIQPTDDIMNNQFSARYNKRHLVAFGEYMPLGFEWFTQKMNIDLGTFTPGSEAQIPFKVNGVVISPTICYEDLFIEEVYRTLPQGNLILNVSNLGWYDDSIALPQHLQISRMRSLETARPLIRSTNTGVTAMIDPKGHVVASLPVASEHALVVDVPAYEGTTPFVWLYQLTHGWFLEILLFVLCAVGFLPLLRLTRR